MSSRRVNRCIAELCAGLHNTEDTQKDQQDGGSIFCRPPKIMSGPYVTIDLEKIEQNARTIVNLCARYGIEVTGVTKVTCGIPQVAKAMLRGGVSAIGESRIENIQRLKANGVHAPFLLLRTPHLSAVQDIVNSVDMTLNSEIRVIEALSNAAQKRGSLHDIILMVDLGDLREGIWPDDLLPIIREVMKLPSIRIVGIGTNLSCYGGVVPTEDNMNRLVEYACQIESDFHLKLRYISGGNSSALNLIASGKMPERINHVRIGEAILLGRETVNRMPWPETSQDAFLLHAEVIEKKKKPSVPIGETSEDAFGNKPVFEDKGDMFRAILNIGREDVDISGITPRDSRLSILGASSDHLLVDVTAATDEICVGYDLKFTLNYGALLAVMTSMYVEKRPLKEGRIKRSHKGVVLLGVPSAISHSSPSKAIASFLRPGFEKLGYPLVNKGDLIFPFLSEENTARNRSFREKRGEIVQIAEIVAEQVQEALSEDYVPLVLSSDPAASLGTYLGLAQVSEPLGLIVFSAYGGFQIPDGRSEETIRRMVLASALGYGDTMLAACGGINPKFQAEHVVLAGIRELSPEETTLMQHSPIKVFTIEDIDSSGMQEVCYRALRIAGTGTTGIHVTFDLSVLDPKLVPGILDPLKGGISYREAHLAMEMIARSGLLISIDVVGFCCERDHDLFTAKTAAEFILSLFGKKILG